MDDQISTACAVVPGLIDAVLLLLPDGIALGGIGSEDALDHEPLVRAALHCLSARVTPAAWANRSSSFVEYSFVFDDELIVVQRGRVQSHLALAIVCTRECNLALVLSSTRAAMGALEQSVDLTAWESSP